MVRHQRIYLLQLLKKGEAEPHQKQQQMMASKESHHHLPPLVYDYDHSGNGSKRPRRNLLRLICLLSLLSFTLVYFPRLLFCSSSSTLCPVFYSFGAEEELGIFLRGRGEEEESRGSNCSAPIANATICCDRTAFRTDVCFMRGDVRTHSASKSILLHPTVNGSAAPALEERIRPYTRKWETSIMATIDELRLRAAGAGDTHRCDVRHEVPAVVFSTGGYTGNVYHDFNDGVIPLYITSRRFKRRVVFVILECRSWWLTKYSEVLSRLSDHRPIDFSRDNRTHCFREAIVGLKIHSDLSVDAALMENNETILDFRQLLDDGYRPRMRWLQLEDEQLSRHPSKPEANPSNTHTPKLVILSRTGSRAIENEAELAALADEVGFKVEVLRPERTTELARIYRELNASDAMIGVHGAAMTHFLFMRPGSVFIQIVPLGTDWAAETYYGEPATKMGLWYSGYKVRPRESSLYHDYEEADPVLRDPRSVAKRGWEVMKRVYLDRQNVRLDLNRFRKRLVRAHKYLVSKKRSRHWHQGKKLQKQR